MTRVSVIGKEEEGEEEKVGYYITLLLFTSFVIVIVSLPRLMVAAVSGQQHAYLSISLLLFAQLTRSSKLFISRHCKPRGRYFCSFGY